nr:Uma2 family endonuclease [Calothrix sp. MO_167.B42]
MEAVTIDFKPILDLTDEQFFQLCQANKDLRFERNATGELIIMPPVGGESSN